MARHDPRVGYGLPTLLAVALHLAILVFSVIRFPASETEPPDSAIVQATLVSTETTTDQAQRAEEARTRANEAEADRQAEEEEAAREAEEDAAEEAERQQEQEADRAREAEARERQEALEAAEAEATRRVEQAEEQARLREEQEAERRRQEEAEAERRRQEEEEAERRRQEEEEAERRRQEEEEAERRRQEEAEAERRRQEEARRAAEAASQGLDRAIEGESDEVANARQAQEAANSFINLVRRAVEQAWVIPPNAAQNASAQVSVRLGPSGELLEARITEQSGDGAFDRSVIQAVEAAAPFGELRELPAAAQRDYRQFNLRFTPGDIR